MKRASAWLFSLGLLACGTPANPPAPTSAQTAPASTGSAAAQTKSVEEPQVQELPPPKRSSPEPPPEPPPQEVVGEPGQPVPRVPGHLPAVPDPNLAVTVTLEKILVGDVTVELDAGALPEPKSPPQAIVDAVLASEEPVAWVVDAGVPAATLHTLLGFLPAERTRVLVLQTAKGRQGAVPLVGMSPAGAPLLRIAPDGFHLSRHSGGKEYDVGPDQEGETFNYVRLRDKAKASRTKFPDVAGIYVDVDGDVTVEVLARAISQLRGPKCSIEPGRCWLPDVAFGEGIKTPSGSASGPKSKPKLELSKPAGTSNAPGTVKVGKLKVGEGLDASKVGAVLKRRSGFVRMCYFAALADAPKLTGAMTLRLTLGADGKVIEVGVPKSSLEGDAVEACLTRGFEGLRFPAPTEAPVAVDVPLTFKLR